MAWRRNNRRRPPGQQNPGGGGRNQQVPPKKGLGIRRLMPVPAANGTIRLSIEVEAYQDRNPRAQKPNIERPSDKMPLVNEEVVMTIDGHPAGRFRTTASGLIGTISEPIDPQANGRIHTVGAYLAQQQDVVVQELLDITKKHDASPPVVANFLRLGHDAEYVGQYHDVPGFALKRKENEVTPAATRKVMLECQNEHLETSTDNQGRFVFTVEVHGKGARATITCDDAKEIIYLHGPAFHGVKHLPPQGRRPDRNAPWPIRALDALREGANSGRREGDMTDRSNAYADVEAFTDRLPFFLPSLFSMTGRWLDIVWSALVVTPLTIALTYILATGWAVFGIMTIVALTCAFATHSWFGVHGLAWLLRGTDNRRWYLCIMMVIALTTQLYRAPWQLQPSDFSIQTSQSVQQYWNRFSDWVEGGKKPSTWAQQAKEWLHTEQPEVPSRPILYGPVRTKGFVAFWLIIWMLITVLYFPVAFEDEVIALRQKRAAEKAEAEYHKAVLESLLGGKSPPQKPQPHEGRYDSHFEGLSKIALLGVVLEEVRETLSGIRGWRRRQKEGKESEK